MLSRCWCLVSSGTAFALPFQNGSFEVVLRRLIRAFSSASCQPVIPGWLVERRKHRLGHNAVRSWNAVEWHAQPGSRWASGGSRRHQTDVRHQCRRDLSGLVRSRRQPQRGFPAGDQAATSGHRLARHHARLHVRHDRQDVRSTWVGRRKTFNFVATGPTAHDQFRQQRRAHPESMRAPRSTTCRITASQSMDRGPPAMSSTDQGTPSRFVADRASATDRGAAADFTYQSPANGYCCHTGDLDVSKRAVTRGRLTASIGCTADTTAPAAAGQLTPFYVRGGGRPTASGPLSTPIRRCLCNRRPFPPEGSADGGQIDVGGTCSPETPMASGCTPPTTTRTGRVGGWLTVTHRELKTTTSPCCSPRPIRPLPRTRSQFTATVPDSGQRPHRSCDFTQEGKTSPAVAKPFRWSATPRRAHFPVFRRPPTPATSVRSIAATPSTPGRRVPALLQNTGAVAAARADAHSRGRDRPTPRSFVIGRADGVLDSSVTFNAFAGSSCARSAADRRRLRSSSHDGHRRVISAVIDPGRQLRPTSWRCS